MKDNGFLYKVGEEQIRWERDGTWITSVLWNPCEEETTEMVCFLVTNVKEL